MAENIRLHTSVQNNTELARPVLSLSLDAWMAPMIYYAKHATASLHSSSSSEGLPY